MMTLKELMKLVRRAAPPTDENYPKRAGLTGDDALAFDLTHAGRHLEKNWGVVAAMLERHDHGEKKALDKDQLRAAAAKLLGNAAGLCELLGMTADELELRLKLGFVPK